MKNQSVDIQLFMLNKTTTRNPFVALCEHASSNNWCWYIYCTTCGHSAFKVSFSKLTRGQHPDGESFWPYGKNNHDPIKEKGDFGDFFGRADVTNQIKLASIVSEAKLSDIQTVAKFPDWLGYIGLALNHCSSIEAGKILSNAFLPQFIALVEGNKEMADHLKKKQLKGKLLNLGDLNRIENCLK